MIGSERSHIDQRGIRGIHHNVVDDQAAGVIELGQPAPRRASVSRFVDPACGGAEIQMTGLAGNGGKCARIATLGADRAPRRFALEHEGTECERNQKEKELGF